MKLKNNYQNRYSFRYSLVIMPRETKGKIGKPNEKLPEIWAKREAIKADVLGHVAVVRSISSVVVNNSQTPIK